MSDPSDLSDAEVLLTALYPEKGKVIARFFKADATKPTSFLNLKMKDRKINEIRMDGQFVKESDGRITLKPWEIKTFLIDQE